MKQKETAKIVILPGDYIGPEVIKQAQKVLQIVANTRSFKHQIDFEIVECAFGGIAIDECGKFAYQFSIDSNG
jgi:3-isopropylmalate dehydrogenase